MFSKTFGLFSILGFRVSLDLSWFLLAVLIVWSLATGYFPGVMPELDPGIALGLAIAGALGLFVSIIFHEFAHAIVARRFEIPIAGITLFIFGGVAEMEREPPSARSEFLMAIAGPIASYVLAALFHGVSLILPEATAAAPAAAVFVYLALINGVLATFNLIPAFPLDGGRVFRAAIWWWTGNLEKATRFAAGTGRVLGTVLMILGVLSVITGNFIAGMWQALIGLFIIGAARSSEFQMLLRTSLQDVPVRRVMVADPVTIPARTQVETVIEDYFYRFSHKVFPVERDGVLIGFVRLDDVGRIAPEDRARLTAGDILSRDSVEKAVAPGLSVLDALTVMRNHGTSRLMVTENGRISGMLTMRDIMNHAAVRRELERHAQADDGPHAGAGSLDRG